MVLDTDEKDRKVWLIVTIDMTWLPTITEVGPSRAV